MKLYTFRAYDTDIYALEYNPIKEKIIVSSVGSYNRIPLTKIKHPWYEKNGYKPVASSNGMYFSFINKSDTVGLDYRDSGFVFGDTVKNDRFNELIYQDGEFIIDDIVASDIKVKYPKASWVSSLGYTLVINGKKDIRKGDKFDHSNHPQPRTMIGQKKDGTILQVVTDGRTKDDKGLTCDQQAEIMLFLDCELAINADGGGSVELVINENGVMTIVNNLVGGERPIPQAIMLYSKEDIVIEKVSINFVYPTVAVNYKLVGLNYLRDNGFINDYDLWAKKLDEEAQNWLVFELLKRIHEDLKNNK